MCVCGGMVVCVRVCVWRDGGVCEGVCVCGGMVVCVRVCVGCSLVPRPSVTVPRVWE